MFSCDHVMGHSAFALSQRILVDEYTKALTVLSLELEERDVCTKISLKQPRLSENAERRGWKG